MKVRFGNLTKSPTPSAPAEPVQRVQESAKKADASMATFTLQELTQQPNVIKSALTSGSVVITNSLGATIGVLLSPEVFELMTMYSELARDPVEYNRVFVDEPTRPRRSGAQLKSFEEVFS